MKRLKELQEYKDKEEAKLASEAEQMHEKTKQIENQEYEKLMHSFNQIDSSSEKTSQAPSGEDFMTTQQEELVNTTTTSGGTTTINADEFDRETSKKKVVQKAKKPSSFKEMTLTNLGSDQKTLSEAEAYKILLERLQKSPETIS